MRKTPMNEPTMIGATDPAERPTRVRYKVVTMAVMLAMVTYLDRVCISKLAPNIMEDLGLSKVQAAKCSSQYLCLWHFLGAAAGQ